MGLIFSLLVPGTPTNFSVTYINSTALVLRWQPPPPEQRNGVITRYVINITGLSEARQEHMLSTQQRLMLWWVRCILPTPTHARLLQRPMLGLDLSALLLHSFLKTVCFIQLMCTLFQCSRQIEKDTVTSR